MQQTNTPEVPRVAASVDRETYDALERYRASVEQSTGIKVTMSRAAAAVLNRGLQALGTVPAN